MFGVGIGAMGRVQGPVSSGLWLPSALFALGEQGAWYDPSDMTTLFQDFAGTIPVTALGQPVGLMLDKSGRGNHAFQMTTTKRPLWQQDASGFYHLLFDGIDDFLTTATINFSSTSQASIFSGIYQLDTTQSIFTELSVSANNNSGFYLGASISGVGSVNTAFRTNSTGGTISTIASARATPVKSVTSCYFISGGASFNGPELIGCKTNGVSETGYAGFPQTPAAPFGNYPLFIGSRAGTGLFFKGRIYSEIIRGAASLAEDVANAEKYVNAKTGAY